MIITVFGVGAALSLLPLGTMSRQAMARARDNFLAAGKRVKMILGAVLVAIGLMIVTGLNKEAEAFIVSASSE